MGSIEVAWPFLVCLLEVLLFVVGASYVIFKYEGVPKLKKSQWESAAGGDRPVGSLDSYELWECWSGNLHPGWLCTFRAVAFCYLLFVQIANVLEYGFYVYYYYTQWTFTLLIIYFALTTYISLKELVYSKQNGEKYFVDEEAHIPRADAAAGGTVSERLLQTRRESSPAGFLGYIILVIFEVVAPAVLLTDAVYWLLLVPFVLQTRYDYTFLNVNMHAANAVFLAGEFLLNTLPFPWFRGGYFVLWTAVYVIFHWIVHAVGLINWWPYPILEVSTHTAPFWYLGIAMLHLPCFFICVVLAKAKRALITHFVRKQYHYGQQF